MSALSVFWSKAAILLPAQAQSKLSSEGKSGRTSASGGKQTLLSIQLERAPKHPVAEMEVKVKLPTETAKGGSNVTDAACEIDPAVRFCSSV
jgi:hypothetical protein